MFLAFTLSCMGMSDDVTAATRVTTQWEVPTKYKITNFIRYSREGRSVPDTRLYSLL